MLSPIRTTFHNSVNIVQSSPCQTVSFAGKEYELKVIDEKTPILFQWFEPNPERYKKDEVPIVNTKQHPYLDNVTNAARIESDRMIGIFVDGDFSVNQKTAFSKLERDFENVMIIYREDVDFSMYDRKLSDIYHDIICEQRLRTEDKRDEYLLNLLEKELREISKVDLSLYIDLCNCLILICSIQHQMKVNLWTKNSYRLWLTNWPKTSKPLKTSVSLIGC